MARKTTYKDILNALEKFSETGNIGEAASTLPENEAKAKIRKILTTANNVVGAAEDVMKTAKTMKTSFNKIKTMF
jgi:hypothetical protein